MFNILAIAAFLGCISSAGAQLADDIREITIPQIDTPHPRILTTSADIVTIKNAISRREQPQYDAWLQLKSLADRYSQRVVAAPYTGPDSKLFYEKGLPSGSMASKLALAHRLGGNPDHAAKARQILLAWARATPLPATHFDENIRFANSGMDASRGISGFVQAYDCLFDTFSLAERIAIESWFRAVIPTIQEGISRWDRPFKLSSTDPRGYVESANPGDSYFYGQHYQNHLVSHTMGILLIGYALGDESLVQFAVDSRENPRDFLELFDGMILMAGEKSDYGGDAANPPPQDGEIMDRYRHVENKGLGYSALSLNQLLVMTEVLLLNGIDLYKRVGAHGETMKLPFEYYAEFYRLKDSSIKSGYYKGEEIGTRQISVFEVANKRYPGSPEIVALLESVDRSKTDPDGSAETHFCFPVLTHAVPLAPRP